MNGGGRFEVLVIDKRRYRKPYEMVRKYPGPERSGMVHAPWYRLDEVEQKYPWLRGAADIRDGEKIMEGTPSSLSVLPEAGGVTFVALFIPQNFPTPESHKFWATALVEPSDLLAALIFIGDGGQIYWAHKIYG